MQLSQACAIAQQLSNDPEYRGYSYYVVNCYNRGEYAVRNWSSYGMYDNDRPYVARYQFGEKVN